MEGDEDRRLDAAVSLGIITAEQASAIRDLTPPQRASAAPQPIGGATLGYVLGAITVLVAMGWFLADRWEWLGPGGVIAVSVLYAALFLVVAHRLRREGASQAAGFAVLLAVAMVPIGASAVLELAGAYPDLPAGACSGDAFDFWLCRGEELTIELVTVLAALIALTRVRFGPLVLPLAGLFLRAVFLAAEGIAGGSLAVHVIAWVWVIAASLMTAIAYTASRRQRGDEDFALWLHLVAGVSVISASGMLLGQVEAYRHLAIPAAFVAFAFSVRMRRAVWTLVGLGWFVVYLGWLAAEVFRETPFFPIVLAALGVGLIIATVWIQRHREALVARFGRLDAEARPSFPGGVPLILAAVLAAAMQLPSAMALDRLDRVEREAARRANRALAPRRAAQNPVVIRNPASRPAAAGRSETPPSPQP